MFDIKPTILNILKEIEGVEVTDTYPKDWTNLPTITFYEQLKQEYNKRFIKTVVQIDIWNTKSTGPIAEDVNDKLTAIGLICDSSRDVPDPNIKHKTMRYKGIIDPINMRIYQEG